MDRLQAPRGKARELRWREPDTPDGRWVLEPQGRGIVVFAWFFLAFVAGWLAFGGFVIALEKTWAYVPAVLFGSATLACLATAGHQLLSLVGPSVVLEVDHMHAPLGGNMTAYWRLHGGRRSVRAVMFVLVGKERRTVPPSDGPGPPSTSEFYVGEVVRVSTGACWGVVEIPIPAGSMHSFVSDHHEIEWSILMHADIDWWPDYVATFKIVVSPAVAQ